MDRISKAIVTMMTMALCACGDGPIEREDTEQREDANVILTVTEGEEVVWRERSFTETIEEEDGTFSNARTVTSTSRTLDLIVMNEDDTEELTRAGGERRCDRNSGRVTVDVSVDLEAASNGEKGAFDMDAICKGGTLLVTLTPTGRDEQGLMEAVVVVEIEGYRIEARRTLQVGEDTTGSGLACEFDKNTGMCIPGARP